VSVKSRKNVGPGFNKNAPDRNRGGRKVREIDQPFHHFCNSEGEGETGPEKKRKHGYPRRLEKNLGEQQASEKTTIAKGED